MSLTVNLLPVECRKNLDELRGNQTGVNQSQLLQVRKKMTQLLMQDDVYWCQQAKAHWYKNLIPNFFMLQQLLERG